MTRRHRAAVLLLAGGLATTGCTPAGAPPPAPAPAASAPTAGSTPADPAVGRITVERVIDLGGAELLGLAVRPDAVWAIAYQASTLSKVDPATNTVTRSVAFTQPIASVLAAADGLWVASYGGGSAGSRIVRVDPGDGHTIATVETGEVCCDLSFGDGALWAADPGGAVLRIDVARNVVAQRYPVPMDRNAHTNVVYAGGAAWASSDTTRLSRVDTRTGGRREFDVGGGVPFLARDGLVWGAAPSRLWAVDAVTGAVVRQLPLAGSMEVLSLAIEPASIWVGLRHPGGRGAVLRLDPTDGRVLAELADISIPARIETGFGSVWVTDSGSRSLYRLAPA